MAQRQFSKAHTLETQARRALLTLANQAKPRHLLMAMGLGNASSMCCTVLAQVQLMVFHLSRLILHNFEGKSS